MRLQNQGSGQFVTGVVFVATLIEILLAPGVVVMNAGPVVNHKGDRAANFGEGLSNTGLERFDERRKCGGVVVKETV